MSDPVRDALAAEFARVINCASAENASNTPDFILGQFLSAALAAFNVAVQQRETWYGRDARPALAAAPAQPMTCDGCGKPVRPLLCGHCAPASEPQAEPQPEAIPIAPVEVVRQALKELLESISECRMDQVTARFAKASVMARAVVDRYKDAT